MKLKEPKTIIRNLFKKYAIKKDNVVYADKLFVINSIITYLYDEERSDKLNKDEIIYYGELIDKFLKKEIDIQWRGGKLVVSDPKVEGG